jgi:hypothetical protein
METKETTIVNFRLSPDELQIIDTKASSADLNRTDYIRARLFAPEPGPQIEALEKQLHELTDRLGREAEKGGQPCSHKCSRPEHYKIWGVGYCFDCEMPMRSRH